MSQTGTCFLFAAGEFWGLHTRPQAGDLILAADGGYHHCLAAGLCPALIVGDLDSIGKFPGNVPTLRFPAEKDDTDGMLAILAALARGYRRFALYGFAGGRLDHTLGNLQALGFLARQGCDAFLYAKEEVFTAVFKGSLCFSPRATGSFSTFCMGADTTVSITGAQYALDRHKMQFHVGLGLSNRFLGEETVVTAHDGLLLLSFPPEGDLPALLPAAAENGVFHDK